jgi:hypothetical protein
MCVQLSPPAPTFGFRTDLCKFQLIAQQQYGVSLLTLQSLNVNHRVIIPSAFFLGGRWGTRTPKHFVNLTGESKYFKMLELSLNQLQTYYGYLCDLCPLTAFIFSDLKYKMVIF